MRTFVSSSGSLPAACAVAAMLCCTSAAADTTVDFGTGTRDDAYTLSPFIGEYGPITLTQLLDGDRLARSSACAGGCQITSLSFDIPRDRIDDLGAGSADLRIVMWQGYGLGLHLPDPPWGEVQVFNQHVSYSTLNFFADASITLQFDTAFDFAPEKGNLLLTLQSTHTTGAPLPTYTSTEADRLHGLLGWQAYFPSWGDSARFAGGISLTMGIGAATDAAPVPEPQTAALLLLGLATLPLLARRRRAG